MTITMTISARHRMLAFLERTPTAVGIRFGVKRTGCSGLGYRVELADAVGTQDHLLDVDGVPMVVDSMSLPLVDGIMIDFQRQGMGTSFVFNNPNATGTCGCGESFTVS